MQTREYAAGLAYTHDGVTLLFPTGGAPQVLVGDATVPIVRPDRFGEWATAAERRAYVRAFVANTYLGRFVPSGY